MRDYCASSLIAIFREGVPDLENRACVTLRAEGVDANSVNWVLKLSPPVPITPWYGGLS